MAESVEGHVVGGNALGKPRDDSTKVGEIAATELLESCSRLVCLDQHAQDQVLLLFKISFY